MCAYPYFDASSEANFARLVRDLQQRPGSVVIGAGLSQQAGLPGWAGLVEALRTAAGAAPAPFVSASAPSTIESLRGLLGVRYLPTLRQVFDLAGKALPDSLRLLSDGPFSQFATTNVDELLYTLATVVRRDGDPSIYVYGSDDFLGKTYYYLHGRLQTATADRHIVLCSSDYARAYGPGGEASRVIGAIAVAPAPLLFLGASMEDADLLAILRAVRNYQVSRSGDYERFNSDPAWFAMLPANLDTLMPELVGAQEFGLELTEEQLTELTQRAVAGRTEELKPVRIIWYQHDVAHHGLGWLIGRLEQVGARPLGLREDSFLASARELDALAELTHPTPGQIQRVVELIRLRGNRVHFYRRAASSWLSVLWERGELKSFPEPQLADDGNYYIEGWDAAGFVGASATGQPETILQMILETKTDNWAVISALARASTELPPAMVRQAMPSFSAWLDGRFGAISFAAYSLSELAARLLDEDQDDIALELFRLLGDWEITNGDG